MLELVVFEPGLIQKLCRLDSLEDVVFKDGELTGHLDWLQVVDFDAHSRKVLLNFTSELGLHQVVEAVNSQNGHSALIAANSFSSLEIAALSEHADDNKGKFSARGKEEEDRGQRTEKREKGTFGGGMAWVDCPFSGS